MSKRAVLALASCLCIALAVLAMNQINNKIPSTVEAVAVSEPTTSTIALAATTTPIAAVATPDPEAVPTTTPPNKIILAVPHIWEIPDGVWVRPWNGACEEASVTMVDQYYKHAFANSIIPTSTAKALMAPLFPIEDKMFGSDSDTDATRTAELANTSLDFNATVVQYPTLDQIKAELDAGHPVISLHYGYGLNNPRHRFRAGASSYHVMVIVGYDDAQKVFYVNDSELPDALDFPYKYDTILTTLHDFDYADKKADGPPVVLFTQPKNNQP